MSGLNISNYLSQISNQSYSENSNISSLFSSLNSSSSSDDLLGISLSDYSSIKNGSYQKLMNKYYSTDDSASEEDITAYKKKQEITADKAATVSSSINDLMDLNYTEDNRSEIEEKISSFVTDYNSLVNNSSSSESSSILQKSKWLTNMVSQYSDSLANTGISVNSDGTLKLDSDKLAKADITDLKSTFGSDVNGFASKVLYKAEQIYSLAKTYGSSATAYTSSGRYSRNYSANYDTNI